MRILWLNKRDGDTRRYGFSLLELMATVAIIGTLAVLVIPRVTGSADMAKEKADAMNRAEINATVERYYLEQGVWPADDLSDIGANINYFPDGIPTNPVSGNAYELDPATHRVADDSGGGGK